MQNLTFTYQAEKKETFTSLELVELINHFREQEGNKSLLLHKNFMAVVRDEFEDEHGLNIQPMHQTIEIANGAKRQSTYYELTTDQAKQVLLRESKFVRRAVIEYINKLEEQLRNQFYIPQTYAEALKLAYQQAEQIEKLELENKVKDQQLLEAQPKVSYYDLVLQSPDLMTVTQIAKDYGESAKSFNQILHENKIQFKQNGTWLLYQQYANQGYTKTKTQTFEKKDGSQGTNVHTYWTQKGRLFLYEKLKNKGIIPMIEQDINK